MMPPIFAEANPSANALKDFLEVVTYLAVFIAAVMTAWKKMTGGSSKTELSGQPIEVRESTTFATKIEHKELEKKFDTELGRERGARKQIHEQIGGLQGDVKVLQSGKDILTRQIGNMDLKMDQVLLRLPRPPSS